MNYMNHMVSLNKNKKKYGNGIKIINKIIKLEESPLCQQTHKSKLLKKYEINLILICF